MVLSPLEITFIVIAAVIGGLILARQVIMPLISPRPKDIGVIDGKFTAQEGRWRNWVSTQYSGDREIHEARPVPYQGSLSEAQTRAKKAVEAMARSKIITDKPGYIHAEFKSFLWGFIDDVELFFDQEQKRIEYRSASRLSGDDHKMNAKRMAEFREKFENA